MDLKTRFVNIRVVVTSCLVLAGLAACAAEFAEDPTRPRPTRAVQSNVERNSGAGEVQGPVGDALPIFSVEYAGKKGTPPTVKTIADPFRNDVDGVRTSTRPASQPATTRGRDPMFDK